MAVVKSAHVEELVRFEDGKEMNKWAVVVDDNGQEVTGEMWLLPSHKGPEVGREVTVDGKRVKFAQNKQAGGGGGKGGGGWKPRLEDDPMVYAAKQAAIAAQTSLERAVDFVDRRGDLADKTADDDTLNTRIIAIAGKYADFIHERAKAAGLRVRNETAGAS